MGFPRINVRTVVVQPVSKLFLSNLNLIRHHLSGRNLQKYRSQFKIEFNLVAEWLAIYLVPKFEKMKG